MAVVRGTTPTFTLTFPAESVDLTEADNVYVTFVSGVNTVTKSGNDLDVSAHEIGVYLSQADTFKFSVGNVDIQANWTINGNRIASEVKPFEITRQLLNKVLE